MIFNDQEITPAIISAKDWLLYHAEHKKVQQVIREDSGNAPDMRVVFCRDCEELLVMGLIQ